MKTFSFAVAALVLGSYFARADELVKNVQSELKNQGFFYSEVTGVNGPETVAAIKRFQIRNGLEVTGTLSKETLSSLGMGGGGAPKLEPPAKPAPTPSTRQQPSRNGNAGIDLRREESVQDQDRSFLKKPTPPAPERDEEEEPRQMPPVSASSGAEYRHVFARTPYAVAPREVQQSTLRRAQRFLSEKGFFREEEDGRPGPDTEEAVLSYQRKARLPMTGRLDMETLSTMRLLPGSKGAPPARSRAGARPIEPREEPSGSRRVYRGVWVE